MARVNCPVHRRHEVNRDAEPPQPNESTHPSDRLPEEGGGGPLPEVCGGRPQEGTVPMTGEREHVVDQEIESAEDREAQLALDPEGASVVASEPETDAGDLVEGFPLAGIEEVVEAGVHRILGAFESKLAYDESKQRQIDRLHKELEQHRSGLVARTADPVIRAMIGLYNDIDKLLSSLQEMPEEQLSPDRFFRILSGLREDVELGLASNGVTTYRESEASFRHTRQRIARKVPTANRELVGAIVESVGPGFELDSRIIEKERVSVYTLVQSPTTEAHPSDTPGSDTEANGTRTEQEN